MELCHTHTHMIEGPRVCIVVVRRRWSIHRWNHQKYTNACMFYPRHHRKNASINDNNRLLIDWYTIFTSRWAQNEFQFRLLASLHFFFIVVICRWVVWPLAMGLGITRLEKKAFPNWNVSNLWVNWKTISFTNDEAKMKTSTHRPHRIISLLRSFFFIGPFIGGCGRIRKEKKVNLKMWISSGVVDSTHVALSF